MILKSVHKLIFSVLFLAFASTTFSQESAVIKGRIVDKTSNTPLSGAVISIKGISGFSETDSLGKYKISAPTSTPLELTISLLGYESTKKNILLKPDEVLLLNFELETEIKKIKEISIEDKQLRRTTMQSLDPKLVVLLPTTGGVESLLKTLPGVASNNELSSQFSVRGGNYDENLIYVNDVEVYRPFLVRSGQQEGLSFINPDLVADIKFSAGGFEAKYGDKMSSVLDITYRRPKKFGGTATGTLLGGSLHLEGATKDTRLSYLFGIRQRSNRYLLRSLDTQGDYRPNFVDVQSQIMFDYNDKWQFSFLGNYARNKYNFIPETRTSRFGTVTQVKQLTVYFDGQEVNDFETYLGSFTASFKPNEKTVLKFISSVFRSFETEKANVKGEYLIYDVEADLGKDNFGDTTNLTGIGTFLNHSRNFLQATVWNAEHKGIHENTKWGIKVQKEWINDKLSEWTLIDSSGYSLPYSDSEINLQDVVKQNINLKTTRIMGYGQQDYVWGEKTEYSLNVGGRFNYWTLNKQFLFSPRALITMKPDWEKDWLFKFATGYYYQPPFYRELRDFTGTLNTGLRAQTSIHFVAGANYQFKLWNRPMKFTGELYYKYLDNLVPYKIENVRLRYFANNSANGYATGIDLKLNGEFVPGAESWVSLSVMQTMEDIKGDFYYKYYNAKGEQVTPGFTNDAITRTEKISPGYIPRPTDQRVNVGLFFQDYVPKFPTFKVHINLLYGSGMPFGPNGLNKYADTLRIPSYRRIDMGFSKQLIKENSKLSTHKTFKYIKSAWISLEVFNLLQVKNTISYLWVKDYNNLQFAIPNYLTNRQLNLKLIVKF